jgi:hypothetical protein
MRKSLIPLRPGRCLLKRCSPDRLGLGEVREYQLHLMAQQRTWSLIDQVVCPLQFFYALIISAAANGRELRRTVCRRSTPGRQGNLGRVADGIAARGSLVARAIRNRAVQPVNMCHPRRPSPGRAAPARSAGHADWKAADRQCHNGQAGSAVSKIILKLLLCCVADVDLHSLFTTTAIMDIAARFSLMRSITMNCSMCWCLVIQVGANLNIRSGSRRAQILNLAFEYIFPTLSSVDAT